MPKFGQFLDQFGDDVVDRVSKHLEHNPFRIHFTVWVLIGTAFGFLLLPDFKLGSIVGFLISGCLCCSILSFLTYPLSGHYSLTLVGALTGAAMAPLFALMYSGNPIGGQAAQLCLLVGALIGGTSMVWRAPLTIFKTASGVFSQAPNAPSP